MAIEPPTGGWTPETLYQHFTKLREADLSALKAAKEESDYRLKGMNEFRETISDVISKCLTRAEAWTFLFGIIGALGSIALIYGVLVKR